MRAAAALAGVVLAISGCTTSAATEQRVPGQPATGPSTGPITVFAAASLADTFADLARSFEAAHPGSRVTLSLGPSSGLAQQIVQGAPADVFASASASTMDVVTSAGAAATAKTFATNMMQVAVPPANEAGVSGVSDLARRDVKVALCQQKVPCGEAAAKVLAKAGVRVTPVTLEVDVRAVLAKVQLDEVDAGIVYVTDVKAAAGKVRGIPIPAGVNASTDYRIAVLDRSERAEIARQFVDHVLSAQGRDVLTRAGFSPP